jgi:dihydroorotase
LAKKYGTRLYILHTSSEEEIALIAGAKKENLPVFAETTPHHLFLNTSFYPVLGGKAVVNPPLRAKKHQAALFSAIRDGVIDTIGSDHAPHTLAEKARPYGECPSGMPGIETTLPLLLSACKEGLLSLDKIIDLTCNNPRKIFSIPENDDWILVDHTASKTVNEAELATRCGWSAFAGRPLCGWPAYVKVADKLIHLHA